MSDDKSPSSKVVLPQQPTGVGPGFLSSYWSADTPLKKMNSWEYCKYFFGRGIANVVAIPLSSGITIGTIAVALFILGGFLLILQNIDKTLSSSGAKYELIAYLRDDIEPNTLEAFLSDFRANSHISTLEFVSKEEALEEFQQELGSNSALLEGLAGANPLPASVLIGVKQNARAAQKADELVNSLRNSKLVTEVVYASEWIEQSQELLKVFRNVGLLALLVVLVIVIFLISNTIRLVIYVRRNEISIMLLVGASDDAIKIPFMIGGLFQGVVGSLLGLGFLRLAFLLIRSQLSGSPVIGVAMPNIFFLSGFSIIAVLLLGAGVGCLGSMFALRKFMNV